MNRVINHVPSRNRHRRIMKLSKGFKGSLSKLFISANQALIKGFCYSYVGRKSKKHTFAKLWTNRINASCKNNKSNYNLLKRNLSCKKVNLNRKMVAEISVIDKVMTNKLLNIN